MKKTLLVLAVGAVALYLFAPSLPDRLLPAAEAGGVTAVKPPPRSDPATMELKWQQLAEREAAVRAKEEALRRLSAQLDARVRELNAARKGIEASVAAKKKQDGERYQKMIKIFKALKPDQAATLLNKLDSRMVIGLLDQMDQKTTVKLIPYLNQPSVLEWARRNLTGR